MVFRNSLTFDLATSSAGPLGVSLAAWILTPLALVALSIGLGLLVERVLRIRIPVGVLVPVGLSAMVVLGMPGYQLGMGAWLSVVITLAAAVTGFVMQRGTLRARAREDAFALIAGGGVYLLYLAPVLLAGGWTWTGYNFVNDTAVQLLLADHLFHTGVTKPLGPPVVAAQSTALEHVRIYLETAYPLGAHSLLATLGGILRLRPEVMYQPVISSFAAFATIALAWLLGTAGGGRRLAIGLAAVTAVAANLTFNYALQGNAKEIGLLASLTAAAAAGRFALTSANPVRATVVTAIPLAAALAFYNSAALPYIGCFALALLLASLLQSGSTLRRSLLPAAVAGGVTLVVISLPTLVTVARSAQVVKGTFSAGSPAADLGQLARPLPLSEAAGTWLTGDYRQPVDGWWSSPNGVLIALTFVLAAVGCVWMLRRRESGVLLLLVTFLGTLLILRSRVSPYAAAKMIALVAPSIVVCAALGCAWLARAWRPGAYGIAAVVALGIFASNALSYRDVRLAPIDRMEAMRDIGERYANTRGLLLVDDGDEFAKYFLLPTHMNVALERITPKPAYNNLSTSFMPRNADIDQMPIEFVESFPLIVQRRGPDASRAPANYRLDYENEYYRVWRRIRAASTVVRHVPFQQAFEGSSTPACKTVLEATGGLDAGTVFVASVPNETVELDVARAKQSGRWPPDHEIPRTVDLTVPGRADAMPAFKDGGSYAIWVAASTGRTLQVELDGRTVGAVKAVNTNGEWLPAGTVDVRPGRHRVALVMPEGNLAPGDGYRGTSGPVVFQARSDHAKLIRTTDPKRLCGRRLDWIEALRSRGS
jgi:hypothetical protein